MGLVLNCPLDGVQADEKLILAFIFSFDQEIQKKGCIMPFSPEIYHPMLKRLAQENIVASESVTKLN